jgi:hypothetical protein
MQTLGSYLTLFQGVQQRKIRRIDLADARILRFQQALHVAHSFDRRVGLARYGSKRHPLSQLD